MGRKVVVLGLTGPLSTTGNGSSGVGWLQGGWRMSKSQGKLDVGMALGCHCDTSEARAKTYSHLGCTGDELYEGTMDGHGGDRATSNELQL